MPVATAFSGKMDDHDPRAASDGLALEILEAAQDLPREGATEVTQKHQQQRLPVRGLQQRLAA